MDKTPWSGNLGAKLRIKILSDITSFIITFETDIQLTNIQVWKSSKNWCNFFNLNPEVQFWDAIVSPSSGSKFSISNHPWFAGKKAGEFLELGFQMSFVGDVLPQIITVNLNGDDVCQGKNTALGKKTHSSN